MPARLTTPTRVCIYCRISRDETGDMLGVKRQEKECKKWAEAEGWTVVRVIVDNDVSASGKVPRPGYEEVIDGIKAGEFDGLIVWAPDRLHRRPIELEHYITVCEEHPHRIGMVTAGDYNLDDENGRFIARILGSLARMEVEKLSRRLISKHIELAEAGKMPGNGRKPFGYDKSGTKLIKKEANAIREAVRGILAGETNPYRIAKEWQAAELWPNVRSGSVIRVLTSARIAGRREYRGKVYENVPYPAIVEWSDVLAVRLALEPKTRRGKGTSARKNLLSSLMTCGGCGKPMSSHISPRGRVRYVCRGALNGGCGKVGIDGGRTEALILEDLFDFAEANATALNKAAAKRMAKRTADVRSAADDLADLRAVRANLTRLAGLGKISDEDLEAGLAANDDAVAALGDVVVEPAPVIVSINLRDEWAKMTFERQRATIEAWCESITILQTPTRGGGFDPTRINIVFKGAKPKRERRAA